MKKFKKQDHGGQRCVLKQLFILSRDGATLYESVRPSVGRSVGPLVTLSLFGLLGATYGRVSAF